MMKPMTLILMSAILGLIVFTSDIAQARSHLHVRFQDLPAKVQQAIKNNAKGWTVGMIKWQPRNDKDYYEVGLWRSGNYRRLHVSAEGDVRELR